MTTTYADWIASYNQKHPFVRGLCEKAARAMAAAFPELRVACGFAHWQAHRPIRDQHWWCVRPDGMIVDPTRAQFCGAQVVYEELDLDKPEDRKRIPTGKCMDCASDVYEGDTFCDEACERATRAFMGLE